MNMKLYHLKNAADTSTVGTYPQLKFSNEHNPNYHVDADYSVRKISGKRRITDNIKLPILQTVKYARLTDYLSYSGPGSGELLIFNGKIDLQNSGLNIDEFEKLPIQIIGKEQQHQYNAMQFGTVRDIIHWSNSVFSIVPKEGYTFEGQHQIWHELSEIQFESKDSYLQWRRENRETDVTVIKKHLALNTAQWDVFRVSSPVFGVLCTDKFMNWVKSQGFTGFDFEAVQLDFRKVFVAAKVN